MRDALSRSLPLGLALAAGCASVDPRPDFVAAADEVRAATGAQELFDPTAPERTRDDAANALADGLGLEEATRLALLDNRRLQAGFLSLGVARAEYVQAGLLENPSLSLAFLLPESGGRVRWNADLLGSVAEIWRIPARQALARAGIEERILELSRFAGELVADARVAYFESVAARESAAVAQANLELARRAAAGVHRQVEGGTATRTDEALAQSLVLAAELAFQRTQREEASSLRRLAALLSLDDDLLGTTLTDPLPDPIATTLERETLAESSVRSRSDVRASERAVAAAEARAGFERRRRFGLDAGLSAERPEGGGPTDLLAGPAASLELPIFDQNQARIRAAEFEVAQRRKEHEALVTEVRQAVRAAVDRASIAAQSALFARERLAPQAADAVASAEKAYALGDTTVLTLLQAQRTALDARRAQVEAALEAALARVELERAAGAPLESLDPRLRRR